MFGSPGGGQQVSKAVNGEIHHGGLSPVNAAFSFDFVFIFYIFKSMLNHKIATSAIATLEQSSAARSKNNHPQLRPRRF